MFFFPEQKSKETKKIGTEEKQCDGGDDEGRGEGKKGEAGEGEEGTGTNLHNIYMFSRAIRIEVERRRKAEACEGRGDEGEKGGFLVVE